jgi:hypothetical protein
MDNPTACQQLSVDHQRQVAWVNEHGWQCDGPKREHRVRRAMAKGLVLLALRLAPPSGKRQAESNSR